jgi:hypothetical protein
MKRLFLLSLLTVAYLSLFTSCRPTTNDAIYISKKPVIASVAVTNDTLCGAIKGTLKPSMTYYLTCPVTINPGDTLIIPAGDTIAVVNPAAYFLVQGDLISRGTQAAPNWITVPSIQKMDNVSTATTPSTDPAFTSPNLWCGIQCDTSCKFLVLKWTHLEYVGATFKTSPIAAVKASGTAWPVTFSNPNGYCVIEDSWIYGSVDDGMRFAGGNICIMRSTFEKISYTSGDCLNAKHGTVGIMAYNLFVGTATNGTKASDKGSGASPTCNIDMYNNTYVNGGFRQSSTAHGANIDYEQNARGYAYNNLIVNCKVGFRVVGSPVADTADLYYGNTYYYGDADSIVDQFYPVGNITIPHSTDIPNPSYLPSWYKPDTTYTAPQLVQANNPMFVNYPLPCPSGAVIDYASGFDFHLQGSSPAVGKGATDWTPMLNPVPVDSVFGATKITGPGHDIGCYQMDGSGNQH